MKNNLIRELLSEVNMGSPNGKPVQKKEISIEEKMELMNERLELIEKALSSIISESTVVPHSDTEVSLVIGGNTFRGKMALVK